MADRLGRAAKSYLADLGVLQDQGARVAPIPQAGRVANDSAGLLA